VHTLAPQGPGPRARPLFDTLDAAVRSERALVGLVHPQFPIPNQPFKPSTEAKNHRQPSPYHASQTKNTRAALAIVLPPWSLGPLDVPTACPPTSRDMTGVLSKRQQARNEKVLQELVQTVPGNNFCADCQTRNPCN